VTAETRERVVSAAAQLNYRANHVARSLKTKSTRTVAIVAPELANDFFMELAEGMEKVLDTAGFTLLVASSSNSLEQEKNRLSMLSERLVDGFVVIPSGSQGAHLQALSDRGTPVVLVDRLVEGAELDAVLSDNEGGSVALTRALLDEGFRRISFVGGDLTISTARERLSGFARALAEANLSMGPESLRLGGMGIEDGYKRMDEILASAELPEAVVAVNLLVHLGMERRLLDDESRRLFGNPAARLVIAAFDETPYTPFFPYCLFTAAQNPGGLGAAAAKLILEKINRSGGADRQRPERIRLPVAIIKHQRGLGRERDGVSPSLKTL
jgi:LacI family transcriptional regulator